MQFLKAGIFQKNFWLAVENGDFKRIGKAKMQFLKADIFQKNFLFTTENRRFLTNRQSKTAIFGFKKIFCLPRKIADFQRIGKAKKRFLKADIFQKNLLFTTENRRF